MENRIFYRTKGKELKKLIGNNKVVCGLSGGVDSSVTAYLLHKAIGKNLYCIFVDHGFLRRNESKEVINSYKKKFKNNFITIDSSKFFLKKLKNISDPESKRKIIGEAFVNVFNAEAKKIKNVNFLAQGTLYPDVIESISFLEDLQQKLKVIIMLVDCQKK